jgi:hypothetical protein
MSTDLQRWQKHSCFFVDPASAQQQHLALVREARTLAAHVALHGMALVQSCSSSVDMSQLVYVHAPAFRPRQVCRAKLDDWASESVVPAICRTFLRSRPLRVGLLMLWPVGTSCGLLVLFDRVEPGSVHEGAACAAVILTLPTIFCNAACLNAKTVRYLLTEFEALYVLAFGLGLLCLQLLLYRANAAKLGCVILLSPSALLAGFMDAYIEDAELSVSRLRALREFFVLFLALGALYLAGISLDLSHFDDYTFHVRSFSFVASSMACSAMMTLLLFGIKNVVLSMAYPGSLVVPKSDLCCVRLDADVIALTKAAHSLLGVAYGKRKVNKTVDKQLRAHRASIVSFGSASGPGRFATAVAPAAAN